jgi:hypothetical protein
LGGAIAAVACRTEAEAPFAPAPVPAPPPEVAAPRKPVPPLGAVAVSFVASPDVLAAVSEADVRALVRKRLLATGVFGREGPGPYAGEASVLCLVKSGPKGGPPFGRAAVTISLDSQVAPRIHAKILAEKPVPGARGKGRARREALHAFLSRAISDAARLVAIQARLEHAATLELIQAVRDPDRDVRDHAVQILGARRAREAVPVLIDALADRDPEVGMHAIGALVSVGDRRAVPKIIELTRRKSGLFLQQLLWALGSLGGREAEAFLWSMGQGHPDPQVQRAAEEALQTLRRKRERGR